jgi:hypothetical protein
MRFIIILFTKEILNVYAKEYKFLTVKYLRKCETKPMISNLLYVEGQKYEKDSVYCDSAIIII